MIWTITIFLRQVNVLKNLQTYFQIGMFEEAEGDFGKVKMILINTMLIALYLFVYQP